MNNDNYANQQKRKRVEKTYCNLYKSFKRRKMPERKAKTQLQETLYNPYLEYSSTDEQMRYDRNMRHKNQYDKLKNHKIYQQFK